MYSIKKTVEARYKLALAFYTTCLSKRKRYTPKIEEPGPRSILPYCNVEVNKRFGK